MMAAAALVLTTVASLSTTTNRSHSRTANDAASSNDTRSHQRWTPSQVAKEDFDELVSGHSQTQVNKMPTFTADQVAENNGDDGKPIWVTYGTYCCCCCVQ
jgi:hypothetical protein